MKKFTIAWYQANPSYVKAQNEIYDKKYPSHWKRPGDKDYYKVKLKAHKIRAEKLNRFPRWADESKIEEIFRDAPDGVEIDHIVPMQGALVSGLHVENNLQYLTTKENCQKSNKFLPRYFKRNYAEISLF
jgi:hypothetical protein